MLLYRVYGLIGDFDIAREGGLRRVADTWKAE